MCWAAVDRGHGRGPGACVGTRLGGSERDVTIWYLNVAGGAAAAAVVVAAHRALWVARPGAGGSRQLMLAAPWAGTRAHRSRARRVDGTHTCRQQGSSFNSTQEGDDRQHGGGQAARGLGETLEPLGRACLLAILIAIGWHLSPATRRCNGQASSGGVLRRHLSPCCVCPVSMRPPGAAGP